ncbi:MAG: hypothetical protein IH944_11590 [Armatimonadetes bacterium]|nr:hypothetical protein [Armatimonadota bacterium]
MRRITLALIALMICTAGSAQESLLAKISLDHKLTTTEAAAAVLIGNALGIKVEWVIGASRDSGVHLHNIGPAIVISHHSGYSLHDVLRQKPKGEGWGNVAKRMGMHPGTFNKMRVKGNDFENIIWINMLGDKYGFSERSFFELSKRGLKRDEIVAAVVMSNGKKDKLEASVTIVLASRPKATTGAAASGKGNGKGKGKGRGKGG